MVKYSIFQHKNAYNINTIKKRYENEAESMKHVAEKSFKHTDCLTENIEY